MSPCSWSSWIGPGATSFGRRLARRSAASSTNCAMCAIAGRTKTPFSSDDADRALDSSTRLLTAVSAPQADEVGKMKMELRRLIFDEQVRSEKRKSAGTAIESAADGQPQAVARGGHAAPGRRERPLPAGRVRGRPLAGASRRRHGRVQEPGRVLPPHLSDREPEGDCWSARCGALPARAATRSCSSRPTSAAARRTRCWRSITCSPASRPTELAGIDAVMQEAGAKTLPTAQARRAGRQQDLARQSRHQARRHRRAHALGRAGLAAWRQEGVRAHQGRR